MMEFTFKDLTRYNFLKSTLNDNNKFIFDIDKKINQRYAKNIEKLRENKSKYQQDNIDIEERLKYYSGIEEQFGEEDE